MAHEARVEKNMKSLYTAMENVAISGSHTTNTRSRLNSSSGFQRSSNSFGNPTGRGSNFRGSFSGGYRGGRFSKGRYFNNNRVQCQLCGILGHVVSTYYYRFDQSFLGPSQLHSTSPQGNLAHTAHTGMLGTPETVHNSTWSSTSQPHSHHEWYPNSGATNHITADNTNLMQHSRFCGAEQVHMGDGKGLHIQHIGSSTFHSPVFTSKRLSLTQMLHVPHITKNLLSVSRFSKDNNVFFEFHPDACFVKDLTTHDVLLQGYLKDGLYVFPDSQINLHCNNSFSLNKGCTLANSSTTCKLPVSPKLLFPACNVSSTIASFDVWHNRLGHPSDKVVSTVLSQCNIKGITKSSTSVCSACCLGKLHKFPLPTSSTVHTFPLQLVYSDLWGPSPIPSSSGYRYYVHFIDSFSRFTWIYLLRHKSEAFTAFLNFKTQVELQLDCKIKALQTDWGGEYRSFTDYLTCNGIIHQHPCPHTHEQNGVAERKHRHIVENGLTLLAQASLPLKFWDEAFHTSVYIINRLPSPLLASKSPLEVLFHTQPQYSQLKSFGCLCYPNLKPYNQHKFAYKSTPCTFLGYSLNHKVFKCLDDKGKIFISRNVIFDEHTFPFSQHKSLQQLTSPICSHSPPLSVLPVSPTQQPTPTAPLTSSIPEEHAAVPDNTP